MGSGTAVFDQALESVETNVNWMKNNYKQVEDWLNANVWFFEKNVKFSVSIDIPILLIETNITNRR